MRGIILIKSLLILPGLTCCLLCNAQSAEEWFEQDKLKIRRLEEQITATNILIAHIKKGTSIISSGLHLFSNIKEGDFHIHLGYFDSLTIIKPAVANWPKVKDIIGLHIRTSEIAERSMLAAEKSNQFSGEELRYINNVFNKVLGECGYQMDELMKLLSLPDQAEVYTMSDDERLIQILKIFNDAESTCTYSNSFGTITRLLALHRRIETIKTNH